MYISPAEKRAIAKLEKGRPDEAFRRKFRARANQYEAEQPDEIKNVVVEQ